MLVNGTPLSKSLVEVITVGILFVNAPVLLFHSKIPQRLSVPASHQTVFAVGLPVGRLWFETKSSTLISALVT